MYNTIGAFLGESENNCVITDTRANLIALRNASGLVVGCHYVLTDHVQGRLVAGTTITLHADSSNEFSENVSVNTTYDNEGWRGVYDIDRALVLELQDNRNNIVRGFNGTEVSNFDWGNTSYTNVTVDNATLTVDIGNTAVKQNITVEKIAILNLTNFTGNMNNITFSTAVNANFTGANGQWRYSTIRGDGSFNVSGYTGGGDNYYNVVDGASNINFSNSPSLITFVQNNINSSTITHTGVSTGTFTMTRANVTASNIVHSAGAGNLSITNGVYNSATISHSTGTMTLTNTENHASTIQQATNAGAVMNLNGAYIKQGSNITNQATGTLSMTQTTIEILTTVNRQAGATGNITVNYSTVSASSNIRHTPTNTGNTTISNSRIFGDSAVLNNSSVVIALTRVYLEGVSNVDARTGSGGAITVTDTQLFGSSSIVKLAASTAGTVTVNAGSKIAASSFIQTAGIGNITVSQSDISGASGINVTAGDRNYVFTRLVQTGVARANLSGTGAAITDTHNEFEMHYCGQYNNSASGAANTVLYSEVTGLSGGIALAGTTGDSSLNRIKVYDGTFDKTNNPNAGTYQLWTVRDAGIVTLTNHGAGEVINYLDISNGSSITINKTSTGTSQYINVTNYGTYNMTGTAGAFSKVLVEQGVISHSGGTLTNCSKKMSSTWTVTAGTQNNVHHWNTANKTTALNNANRVDYLGVVSSAPIL